MLKLYENIKRRRKAMKMTQEELANLTGYTDRSSIARIEKGEIDLPQSKIKQFAKALGTTQGDLMGWDEEMKKDPIGMAERHFEILMDEDFTEMFEDFHKLNSSQKRIVKDLVRNLAGELEV